MIGERIRDKVAASKARGMWMGGKVPLGYDVRDRKLVVNEAEAARVRRVLELFVETGSGVETVRRLREEGLASKSGRPLNKGDVYKLLNNWTHVGEVAHKGQVYPGEHQTIVPRELWDRAHAVLRESPRVRANQNRTQAPALLKGLIFGVDGRALSPTHCRRRGRLYRYYVAQRVLKEDVAAGDEGIVRRVSAVEIEAAVVEQVRHALHRLLRAVRRLGVLAAAGDGPERGLLGGVLLAPRDLPERRLAAVAMPVPVAAGAHAVPAGFMRPVVMAAPEHECVLGPDDLRPELEAAGLEALRHGRGVQGAVPDIGDLAAEQRPRSRQSARSSFSTRPVRLVAVRAIRLRQAGSYATPYGGSVVIRCGLAPASAASTVRWSVQSPHTSR